MLFWQHLLVATTCLLPAGEKWKFAGELYPGVGEGVLYVTLSACIGGCNGGLPLAPGDSWLEMTIPDSLPQMWVLREVLFFPQSLSIRLRFSNYLNNWELKGATALQTSFMLNTSDGWEVALHVLRLFRRRSTQYQAASYLGQMLAKEPCCLDAGAYDVVLGSVASAID